MAGRAWAVGAVLLLTACSGAPAPPKPPATTTSSTVDVCVNQLVYWAKDILGNAKDSGLDYQEMGLDADTYEALQALVDEARKQRPLPPGWLQSHAEAACAKVAVKSPTPATSGALGWP